MKSKLLKFLRSCRAQWITSIEEEPIISLHVKAESQECYSPLVMFALSKGWVRKVLDENYNKWFFTEKGKNEILIPLQKTTCITGRVAK